MSEEYTNFLSEKRLELGPWQAFERGLARMLSHVGFKDVKVVNGSGDKGADIVGIRGNELWVVQAKYRSHGSIGISAIEEALNAMKEYNTDVCVTATNRFFSREAQEFNRKKRNQTNVKSYLWNKNDILNYSKKLPFESKNRRISRKYQIKAIEKLNSAVDNGSNRGLITLATGLGKTMVASSFISNFIEENPKANILVLAHMVDLVLQLDQASWPQFNSEVMTHIWTGVEKPSFYEGVVFATWQSVLRALDDGLIRPDYYDLIIVDECHHAPSQSFTKLLKKLKPSFLLGVTATPWRGDEISLRPLFGNPLFSMSVVEGMQKGFLSKVDYRMLTDGIDWDEISFLSKNGNTVKDLNANLYIPERDRGMVDEIVENMKLLSNPRVLVFCRSIKHAERLLNFFRIYDVKTAVLHSDIDRINRFKTLSGFRIGKISVLISVDMLNEGIDVPEVNMVCFARVTHSRRIFLQQLGRGLRLSDNKKIVKVLDFVADIRRVAEGFEMNREASKFGGQEIVNYPEGDIVKFSGDTSNFFNQYLKDMANISDLNENAQLLEYPPESKSFDD